MYDVFSMLGGLLSINHELSQAFNLTGGRKVCVRRVEREEVGVDLMELRFKVCVVHIKLHNHIVCRLLPSNLNLSSTAIV